MLNIRVFALVALATFSVAAVLRALGPFSLARTHGPQTDVFRMLPAHVLPEHPSIGAAASRMSPVSSAGAPESAPGALAASPDQSRAGRGPTEERAEERSPSPQNAQSRPARSESARSTRKRSRSLAVLVRAAAPPSGGLQAEQRQLERVQKALEGGHGAAAARALDEYGAVFPAGELGFEAELLRIDVALARGEREHALALARAFESRPGAERYRERLAAFIGSAARVEPDAALMGSR